MTAHVPVGKGVRGIVVDVGHIVVYETVTAREFVTELKTLFVAELNDTFAA
jgi:hypothetical protein